MIKKPNNTNQKTTIKQYQPKRTPKSICVRGSSVCLSSFFVFFRKKKKKKASADDPTFRAHPNYYFLNFAYLLKGVDKFFYRN